MGDFNDSSSEDSYIYNKIKNHLNDNMNNTDQMPSNKHSEKDHQDEKDFRKTSKLLPKLKKKLQ